MTNSALIYKKEEKRMSWWLIFLICFVCTLAGFLFGAYCLKGGKISAETNGILIVDKVDPVANDGVYFQAFEDPQTYKDGQKIVLEVVWCTEADYPRNNNRIDNE